MGVAGLGADGQPVRILWRIQLLTSSETLLTRALSIGKSLWRTTSCWACTTVVKGRKWEAEPDRVLATVLFTDIVGATSRAAELGDRAWRELLERHHEAVRTQLGRFRGQEVDTAGDGFRLF
jgi:class 3 adenylate cyclase